MPDVTNIILVGVTVDYLNYLAELLQTDPRFLAMGVLPCSQFWRCISGHLIYEVKDTSEYKTWFAEKRASTWLYMKAYWRSLLTTKFRWDVQTGGKGKIYLKGMQNEANFITHTGGLKKVTPLDT